MITIGMTYLLAAVAASGIFIVAGRRSKNLESLTEAEGRPGLPTDPSWDDAKISFDALPVQADVGVAMRLALKRLAPVMASQSVKAEIVVPFGLPVRMGSAALADLLEELLAIAIHAAPASRLLLTGATYGDRIYIGITDDMPGANSAVRLERIRGLMDRVSVRGGSLDLSVVPTEGTTMTLGLIAVIAERWDRNNRPLPEPIMQLLGVPSRFSVHTGR